MKAARRQTTPRADRRRDPTATVEHDSDRRRDGPAGAMQGFVLISIAMMLAHIFTS